MWGRCERRNVAWDARSSLPSCLPGSKMNARWSVLEFILSVWSNCVFWVVRGVDMWWSKEIFIFLQAKGIRLVHVQHVSHWKGFSSLTRVSNWNRITFKIRSMCSVSGVHNMVWSVSYEQVSVPFGLWLTVSGSEMRLNASPVTWK